MGSGVEVGMVWDLASADIRLQSWLQTDEALARPPGPPTAKTIVKPA